jgi:hypothetical protein
MRPEHPCFHSTLVACVADGRPPTLDELDQLAERIWSERDHEAKLFAWRELPPEAPVRAQVLKLALAATNGADID